jgi:hypothetical protein
MSAQHHSASLSHADRDLYARERVLNSAILGADISGGWERAYSVSSWRDSRNPPPFATPTTLTTELVGRSIMIFSLRICSHNN